MHRILLLCAVLAMLILAAACSDDDGNAAGAADYLRYVPAEVESFGFIDVENWRTQPYGDSFTGQIRFDQFDTFDPSTLTGHLVLNPAQATPGSGGPQIVFNAFERTALEQELDAAGFTSEAFGDMTLWTNASAAGYQAVAMLDGNAVLLTASADAARDILASITDGETLTEAGDDPLLDALDRLAPDDDALMIGANRQAPDGSVSATATSPASDDDGLLQRSVARFADEAAATANEQHVVALIELAAPGGRDLEATVDGRDVIVSVVLEPDTFSRAIP